MSIIRDRQIATFEDACGIVPARGERRVTLDRAQHLCLDLIRIIELEKSGIRDGDGAWSGSNPVEGVADEIYRLLRVKPRRPPTVDDASTTAPEATV